MVADADAPAQELLITVTNPYAAAQLTVRKVVVNEPVTMHPRARDQGPSTRRVT